MCWMSDFNEMNGLPLLTLGSQLDLVFPPNSENPSPLHLHLGVAGLV